MKTVLDHPHRLVLRHDDRFHRLVAAIGSICLVAGFYAIWSDGGFGEKALAAFVSAGMCFLVAPFLFEHSEFDFDIWEKRVTWRRRRFFGRSGGVVQFNEIDRVLAERPIGDEDLPSRRLVLVTAQGSIPVTIGYFPDHGDVILELSARIREMVRAESGS